MTGNNDGRHDHPYVLAIDSGTTSVRAILFDACGHPVAQASQEIGQRYPRPGWVEHDATEILAKQASVISEVQYASGIHSEHIAAVGITNQRETTVVWDRHTGEPVSSAICWQCRRTEPQIACLRKEGWASKIREKTGLVLDPYFSATKVSWMSRTFRGGRGMREAGDLCLKPVTAGLFGTLRAERSMPLTAPMQAARCLHTWLCWDEELPARAVRNPS